MTGRSRLRERLLEDENATARCRSCGAPVAPASSFCTSCGAATHTPQAHESVTGAIAAPATTHSPESPADPGSGPATPNGGRVSNWVRFGLPAGIAGLLIVALVVGGLVLTSNQPSATPTPVQTSSPSTPNPQRPAPGGIAQVTVTVTGCDDCTIKAEWSAATNSTSEVDPTDLWNSGELPVTNGAISFPVPVQKSQGLSFDVFSPRDKKEARNVAVVRYTTVPVGTQVTPQQAASAKQAYGCWAGTTFAEANLNLQVDWYTGPDLKGRPSPYLRAYFNPGLATYGESSDAYKGGLSHQNIWACSFGLE